MDGTTITSSNGGLRVASPPPPPPPVARSAAEASDESVAPVPDTPPPALAVDYAAPSSTPTAPPPTPTTSLRQRVLRGSAWTLLGFGAAQALRLVSNLVLTRFLEPSVFGIMALVLTFISGVSLFSDLGLGAAVVQNRRGDDEEFLNTAFTIQALRGLVIWLVLCALAYPAARYYGHFELRTLLPVCGLVALMGGMNSTSLLSLGRHLCVGTITLLNLLSQVVSLVVTLTWLFVKPGIWALIAGQLIGQLTFMVVSHGLTTGQVPARRARNRFAWDPKAASDLFHFGKWIFLCTILYYLQSQVDRLVFDKIFKDLWLLGLYATALQLVQMPTQVIGNLTTATLLPALSRNAERIGSYKLSDARDRIMEARRLILPVGAAAILGVMLGAPLFFQFLYKPIYRPAGSMAQWMAPGIWFALLQVSVDRALQMSNRLGALALSNGTNLLVTALGAAVGAHWGVFGFILGVGAGNLAGLIVIECVFLKEGVPLFRQDVLYTVMVAGVAAFDLLVPRLFHHSPGLHLAVKIGLAVVTLAAVTVWALRRVMRVRGS